MNLWSWQGLCDGPTVPHTGLLKVCKVLSCASSILQINTKTSNTNISVQRVYAIAFPNKEKYKEWKLARDAAAAIDHRVIGTQQQLFMFHPSRLLRLFAT